MDRSNSSSDKSRKPDAQEHWRKSESKEEIRTNASSTEGIEPAPNPPNTTTGPITAPKFGSAGSGGAELEPGPEAD